MKPKGVPLFWRFSTDPEKQAACQVLLMQYQWDNFKTRLEIPPMPEEPKPVIPTLMDMTLEEIGEFMSQAPSKSRGD